MAVSIAELIIFSLIAAWLLQRLGIPGLIGMLMVGVVAGPYGLDLLDPRLLAVGADLRLVALIVILLRAGFELSRQTLHRVGGRTLLLALIPSTVEGLAVCALAPWLLGLSYLESAVLGWVLAAVSPAVVVPMMTRFIQARRGAEKGIPTMILAAASVEDAVVIVIHSVLVGLYTGQAVGLGWRIAGIPLSIGLGVLVGLVCGWVLCRLFERFNPRATKRVLVVVAVSVLLVRLEHAIEPWVPFAALIAAMAIGLVILEKREHMAHEISAKLGKVWVFAEIILFAMVGAQVNPSAAWRAGGAGLALIACGLLARGLGTLSCLWGSDLTRGERLFLVVAYSPKATVQAAIGGVPLVAMRAAGMATGPGEIILAVAVLSIVVTAPAGAWAIATFGERVLPIAPESVRDAYDAATESQPDENGF